MRQLVKIALPLGLLLSACSDPPKEPPPPPPKAGGAARRPTTVTPPKESVIQEARKRLLGKEDFTEADANRDPFRSFLSTFVVQTAHNAAHPILLEKFAIDELKLAGIITGELQPRAMFIDPAGQGVTVIRGNHISKADAVVTRVAADRVYLRIEEEAVGSDKPRIIERQIELHAGELSGQ